MIKGFEGGDDLERALAHLAAGVSTDKLAHFGKRQMEGRVEKEAKVFVAKRTRTLQGSITTQATISDDGEVEIRTGTNVKYGPFVEYGTGKAGAESGADPPPDYLYGPSAGRPAKPFLRPAWDNEKENVIKGLIDDLGNTVDEAARGGGE